MAMDQYAGDSIPNPPLREAPGAVGGARESVRCARVQWQCGGAENTSRARHPTAPHTLRVSVVAAGWNRLQYEQ